MKNIDMKIIERLQYDNDSEYGSEPDGLFVTQEAAEREVLAQGGVKFMDEDDELWIAVGITPEEVKVIWENGNAFWFYKVSTELNQSVYRFREVVVQS